MINDLKDLIANPGIEGFKFNSSYLGEIIALAYRVTLIIAGFLAFFWLVWGGFQYILAKGDKEALAQARARITWAIIGLFFVILAYFITNFAATIFPPKEGVPFPTPTP